VENNWNIQIAFQQALRCIESLNRIKDVFSQVLDGDAVGRDSGDKEGVLDMWNQLPDLLKVQEKHVMSIISEAEEFTWSDKFWELDSLIKWSYWDSIQDTKTALNNILGYKNFYFLLSQIEHTEQTIHFLWDMYVNTRDYVTVLSKEGRLSKKKERSYTNMLSWLKGRIDIEMCMLMNLLEEVIMGEAFGTMDEERRELYHAKWHVYLEKFADLDRS
jgi:energy-converting hydrogenase A subunit M